MLKSVEKLAERRAVHARGRSRLEAFHILARICAQRMITKVVTRLTLWYSNMDRDTESRALQRQLNFHMVMQQEELQESVSLRNCKLIMDRRMKSGLREAVHVWAHSMRSAVMNSTLESMESRSFSMHKMVVKCNLEEITAKVAIWRVSMLLDLNRQLKATISKGQEGGCSASNLDTQDSSRMVVQAMQGMQDMQEMHGIPEMQDQAASGVVTQSAQLEKQQQQQQQQQQQDEMKLLHAEMLEANTKIALLMDLVCNKKHDEVTRDRKPAALEQEVPYVLNDLQPMVDKGREFSTGIAPSPLSGRALDHSSPEMLVAAALVSAQRERDAALRQSQGYRQELEEKEQELQERKRKEKELRGKVHELEHRAKVSQYSGVYGVQAHMTETQIARQKVAQNFVAKLAQTEASLEVKTQENRILLKELQSLHAASKMEPWLQEKQGQCYLCSSHSKSHSS